MTVDRFSVAIKSYLNVQGAYEHLCKMHRPPHFACTAFTTASGYTFTHDYREQQGILVAPDRKHLLAVIPSQRLRGGEALLPIAYLLLERQMQQEGFLTCQAACVALGRLGVLLMDQEGDGKSSVAIELCKQHGGALVGNDLCVIGLEGDRCLALQGTKYFMVRAEAVRHLQPDLHSLFPTPRHDSWRTRIAVEPSQLGLASADAPVEIVGAFLVHTTNGQLDVYASPADDQATRVYLNESFSRHIRATCSPVLLDDTFDFGAYMPPLDSEDLYTKRVELMQFLLGPLSMTYVAGDVANVATFIRRSVPTR
jgi:hypothetical protein